MSVLVVGGLALSGGAAVASSVPSSSLPGDEAPACPAPPSGYGRCGAIQLLHPAQNWHSTATRALPSKAPGGGSSSSAPSSGYYPIDLQSAYGLGNAIALAASTGPGPSAPTVAIVDAYDDPTAASDLATYRSVLGGATDPSTGLTDQKIPPLCSTAGQSGCVTFTKVNQSGGTSYPRADKGWAEEISLDLDMVSAVCPDCNITLVEASSSSFSNLKTAVAYAKNGLSSAPAVVTNSYGGGEFSSETSYNSVYGSSSSTAVTAATGDSGYGVEFPAAAPNLTAVGGTSLTYDQGSWNQTVWSGAGAGCSAYESQPGWQNAYSSASVCSDRQVGDVAAVADPNTGVAVYDTDHELGWMVFGGTSASTQIVGAIYGLAAFSGSEQPSPGGLYANASGNLVPVTTGSDGSCSGTYLCNATDSLSGYNGPTGLGTPEGTGAFTGSAPAPSPGFTVAVTPSSDSITAGGTATYTVTVTPSNSFTGNVDLTASGCPSDVTCSFTSNPVDITGSSSVSSTLAVPTTTSDAGGYTITITGAGTDGTSGTSVTSSTTATLTVSSSSSTGTIDVNVSTGTITTRGPHYHVPLTVSASDASGNALSGASVTLDVYAGTNCSGTAAASGSGTTNSQGQASFTFTTRTSGSFCAEASVSDAGYTTGTGSTTFTT